MKEHGAKWIASACDYLCCNPSISMNGFKEAGILDAMEGKIISVDSFPVDDEDPFAKLISLMMIPINFTPVGIYMFFSILVVCHC